MRKFTWIAVVLVLLVLQMAFFFFASRKDGQVDVRVNPDYQETTYAIIKDGHEFKMVAAQTELNKDVMVYSSNAVSIQTQLPPLKTLLSEVQKKEKKMRSTLYWQTTKSYPEFFARMSDAAQKYPAWSRRSGHGNDNELMVKIANENQVYPELTELFSSLGYTVKVASVEKVIADSITEMPIDFMLWFRVEKK